MFYKFYVSCLVGLTALQKLNTSSFGYFRNLKYYCLLFNINSIAFCLESNSWRRGEGFALHFGCHTGRD